MQREKGEEASDALGIANLARCNKVCYLTERDSHHIDNFIFHGTVAARLKISGKEQVQILGTEAGSAIEPAQPPHLSRVIARLLLQLANCALSRLLPGFNASRRDL